jgi:hypothetical protein
MLEQFYQTDLDQDCLGALGPWRQWGEGGGEKDEEGGGGAAGGVVIPADDALLDLFKSTEAPDVGKMLALIDGGIDVEEADAAVGRFVRAVVTEMERAPPHALPRLGGSIRLLVKLISRGETHPVVCAHMWACAAPQRICRVLQLFDPTGIHDAASAAATAAGRTTIEIVSVVSSGLDGASSSSSSSTSSSGFGGTNSSHPLIKSLSDHQMTLLAHAISESEGRTLDSLIDSFFLANPTVSKRQIKLAARVIASRPSKLLPWQVRELLI